MEYRVLGPLEVRDGGRSIPLAGAKQRAVLALLLLSANRVLARDQLVDQLWGDHPPETAVQSLQVYVSRLRKLLPPGTLVTKSPGYLIEVEADDLDLHRFERLLSEGQAALADSDSRRAATVLHEALELWRGPVLAEFAYEPFAQSEIGRLEDLRLAAIEERIEADLALGRHARLIGEIETLIVANPHRERLRGQQMLALYRSGRQAEALDAYRRAHRVFVDELGITPSAALQRIEKAILVQDEALDAPPTAQVGERDGLPTAGPPKPPTNLPASPDALIGRRRELEALETLVADGARLLTLTGAGGSGKTRLALQLAARLANGFPDGVFFVDFAPIVDPALVTAVIGQTLGVRELPGRSSAEALTAHLGEQRMLLVLDNLEQLVEGTPLLGDILGVCPSVVLLATSREPLHIRGEQEYAVPPLDDADAVELFAERARAVEPAFTPDGNLGEICRRLDNLPLAIELAAARVKAFSPAQILSRLDRRLAILTTSRRDTPARHRTLRATFDWSYDLLSVTERRLCARLATFVAGFTLEAAESVCQAEWDTLQSLVDKSLLRADGGRLAMPSGLREYALERLQESGEADELRREHARWFAALAEEAESDLRSGILDRWLQPLAHDRENLRAALVWTSDDSPEAMARLAADLTFWWRWLGELREARYWLERALESLSTDETALWARVALSLGVVVVTQGDHERASALFEQALPSARKLGETEDVVICLSGLGIAASAAGDLERARFYWEECRAVAAAHDLRARLASVTVNLGDLALRQGRLDEGRALSDEGLRLFTELGSPLVAYARANLGYEAMAAGRLDDARRIYAEILQVSWRRGERVPAAHGLLGIASVLVSEGDLDRAARLFGTVQALDEATGATPRWIGRQIRETVEAGLREQIDDRALTSLLSEGKAMTLNQASDYALESVRDQ